MPTPIVLELQAMATDSQNNISDLLRKALIVATKLKLDDFKKWIESELHGYWDTMQVPEYRQLRGELRAMNPINGLIPIVMASPKDQDDFSKFDCRDPVENIVSLIRSAERGDQRSVTFPLTSRQKEFIMSNLEFPFEPLRVASALSLCSIIDSIRSTILQWSLKLEEAGIVGDGMQFSSVEKEIAATSMQIHIGGNFQGVLGDVSHSKLTQNLTITVRENDMESLAALLRHKGLEEADIESLKRAIAQDETPSSKTKMGANVSVWIGAMIAKAASGTWDISTGAAGELLATALAAYYGIGG